jgi:hypothetical protein
MQMDAVSCRAPLRRDAANWPTTPIEFFVAVGRSEFKELCSRRRAQARGVLTGVTSLAAGAERLAAIAEVCEATDP